MDDSHPMEDKKRHVGGVLVSHEHVAVSEGSGVTANAEGAKAKAVHNVGFYSNSYYT